MTTSAVQNFITTENAYRTPNGITPMVAGKNVVDLSDIQAAGGTMTFSTGFDAVILDGPRSEYQIAVNNTGSTTILDTTTGTKTVVNGESYLIFDGNNLASHVSLTSGAPVYTNDAYFVLNQANAQIAELYAAVLQRQPDMGGLEYWLNSVNNGQTLHTVAESFLNAAGSSAALQAVFGGNPATMTPTAFVTALYQNILDRAPDSSGLAYWVNTLTSGSLDQATVLASFTNANLAVASSNVTTGATPANDTGWMVNYQQTGGLADASLTQPLTTVLNETSTTHFLNTSLIDPTTVSNTNSYTNGISAATNGTYISVAIISAEGATPTTITLSPNIYHMNVANDGDTIISPNGVHSTMTLSANNTVIDLQGPGNTISMLSVGSPTLAPYTNTIVIGYTPGSDKIYDTELFWNSEHFNMAVQLLSPTSTTPVSGANLNFTTTNYVLNVGNVGSGTAAEVASAANAVYHVADIMGTVTVNPNASHTSGFGETLTIIGQSGQNTVMYQWGVEQTAGGVFPTPTCADVNNTHLINANQIQLIATLIGVNANQLTATDFH